MRAALERLGPFDSVLDVGGNVGAFAELCRELWPAARITSFEPIPGAAGANRKRAGERWTVSETAISDQTGKQSFRFCRNQPSASTMQEPGSYRRDVLHIRDDFELVEVDTNTLDDLVWWEAAGRMLVKIDVEGHEGDVIAGGRRVLGLAAAAIVELNQVEVFLDAPSPAEVDADLRSCGLEFAGVLATFEHAGEVVQFDGLWTRAELAPLPPGF